MGRKRLGRLICGVGVFLTCEQASCLRIDVRGSGRLARARRRETQCRVYAGDILIVYHYVSPFVVAAGSLSALSDAPPLLWCRKNDRGGGIVPEYWGRFCAPAVIFLVWFFLLAPDDWRRLVGAYSLTSCAATSASMPAPTSRAISARDSERRRWPLRALEKSMKAMTAASWL